jgi:hypothetical protein
MFTGEKYGLAYRKTEHAVSVSCFLWPNMLRNLNTFTLSSPSTGEIQTDSVYYLLMEPMAPQYPISKERRLC